MANSSDCEYMILDQNHQRVCKCDSGNCPGKSYGKPTCSGYKHQSGSQCEHVFIDASAPPSEQSGIYEGVGRYCCCIARSVKIDKARSRLYRSPILQVNMCLKALAEFYTMHPFAPFSNRIFFFAERLPIFCYFCKIQQIKFRKI